jgi:hypothetical protein
VSGLSFDTVREIGHTLPEVEDGLSYGAPALKVRGRLFIRFREDLNAVVVKTTFEERDELISADPSVYFISDHYRNYEYVLVSLKLIHPDALTNLIRRAYDLARHSRKKKLRHPDNVPPSSLPHFVEVIFQIVNSS